MSDEKKDALEVVEEIKGFKPCGNFVVLLLKKAPQTTTKGGIIIPDIGKEKKDTYQAFVYELGPKAETDPKKGDRVVFNQYDAKYLDKDKETYVVVQDHSIMAIY